MLQNFDVSGAILWSNISKRTSRTEFTRRLEDLGFGSAAPARRTDYAALQAALTQVFKNPTTLIRPLEDNDGFVVVDEDRGYRANHYATRYVAKLPTEPGQEPSIDPYDENAMRVVIEYGKALEECGPSAVTTSLVKIIGMTGGTRLRDHGGVYWIPGDSMETWKGIKGAVLASASAGHAHHMAIVATSYDEETTEAVIRGLTEEIEADIRELTDELEDGDLGKRAMETRMRGLTDKRHKITRYETIFNTGLSNLKDKLEVVKQSEAFATLLAAADSDAPSVFAH